MAGREALVEGRVDEDGCVWAGVGWRLGFSVWVHNVARLQYSAFVTARWYAKGLGYVRGGIAGALVEAGQARADPPIL